ncbi:MAG: hypothetical protein U9N42_02155 [Campylobacterota bacterium]|nr:hypothetical protein [Campylobacterota bacterium]
MAYSRNSVIAHMGEVYEYKNKLESLNKQLSKITLTGKISNLNIAQTLFEFMENTQIEFSKVQQSLIENLVDENIKKTSSEIKSRAQVIVDILVRNLFERTADVGFLATDDDIIKFLELDEPLQEDIDFMHNRLHEYVLKYSVYDEIIILKPDGTVAINLDERNNITHSSDEIISDTLNTTEEFCEIFRYSDLQPDAKHSMIYSAPIVSDSKKIGVLCLCFKIDDEMRGIFNKLDLNESRMALLSSQGTFLSSNKDLKSKITLTKFEESINFDSRYVEAIATSDGYQGYMGQNWHGYVAVEYKNAYRHNEKLEIDIKKFENTPLISNELKEIKLKSEDITEDLKDVVINGEIIASKSRSYSLNPILDGIRDVSENIHSIIEQSIDGIYSTVITSMLQELSFKASLAVDIMDRNLYERANNCRWWALNTTFRQMLADKDVLSLSEITRILEYINSLYTVYTNLFIYDKGLEIIAVSNPSESSIIGNKINSEAYKKTLSNKSSQDYFVTPFEKTPLYNNKATYIYSASISELKSDKNVGGIGIVFDSEVEFKAILDDVVMEHGGIDGRKLCTFFTDSKGHIISKSGDSPYEITDTLEPIVQYLKLEDGSHTSQLIEIENKTYILALAKTSGYREYKKEDNYSNSVYCVILSEV